MIIQKNQNEKIRLYNLKNPLFNSLYDDYVKVLGFTRCITRAGRNLALVVENDSRTLFSNVEQRQTTAGGCFL